MSLDLFWHDVFHQGQKHLPMIQIRSDFTNNTLYTVLLNPIFQCWIHNKWALKFDNFEGQINHTLFASQQLEFFLNKKFNCNICFQFVCIPIGERLFNHQVSSTQHYYKNSIWCSSDSLKSIDSKANFNTITMICH